ncbi:hypothetical protein OKA04_05635 [Luteolibacter flavescens]|uniref:Uncharacterized protein n=1 Tax=Luteolibacter flavescens TaxID=1859460 RepID=A0ABT3FKV7_9BACT|nr:hypothetical protein [Luteolibacter flavescens]MCW1884203.1 hypothetical protein [Luteolibacter flavescens]
MNAPIHAGSEEEYRALEETRLDVQRWRFYCLVKHLCRNKGPLAWWRVHRAWRRIAARHGKSRAVWAKG